MLEDVVMTAGLDIVNSYKRACSFFRGSGVNYGVEAQIMGTCMEFGPKQWITAIHENCDILGCGQMGAARVLCRRPKKAWPETEQLGMNTRSAPQPLQAQNSHPRGGWLLPWGNTPRLLQRGTLSQVLF